MDTFLIVSYSLLGVLALFVLVRALRGRGNKKTDTTPPPRPVLGGDSPNYFDDDDDNLFF